MKKKTLAEWVKCYDNGEFDRGDMDTMIKAGWDNWFCKESSLPNRLKKMVGMIKACAASPKIAADKVYLRLHNNMAPLHGTYDSFTLTDLNTDEVLWVVSAKPWGNKYDAHIWKAPNFDMGNNVLKNHYNTAHDIKQFFLKDNDIQ